MFGEFMLTPWFSINGAANLAKPPDVGACGSCFTGRLNNKLPMKHRVNACSSVQFFSSFGDLHSTLLGIVECHIGLNAIHIKVENLRDDSRS